jgi:hypothetical protein
VAAISGGLDHRRLALETQRHKVSSAPAIKSRSAVTTTNANHHIFQVHHRDKVSKAGLRTVKSSGIR